ncbi:M23 family metallopeptidase [Streptomyces sp. NPDC094034]|uniref:M23 family metallopeptidase n=1 Tax=Streptomyces sp. NPDC094034 TaxID=3155309 RepID=UPI0033204E8B
MSGSAIEGAEGVERDEGVEVSLPFTGPWRVENSPARRVPSHGTDLFGGRYAIDFTAVDARHRSAAGRGWRTFLAVESPELFHAFGRPILAPVDGVVVAVHDGEPDHEARRSQPALAAYALSQGARLRRGVAAVAGNHVIISMTGQQRGQEGQGAPERRARREVYLALAHFRQGSLRVSAGQRVVTGQHLGDCGNSGNSTQPHVHMQAMDSSDLSVARGLPMLFRHYREWTSGPGSHRLAHRAVPRERAVVEPFRDS